MNDRPSFDCLAPIYHILERVTYGAYLHRCRTAHLHTLLACRRALILGDGDGRFLADLLLANPNVVVDSVEISRGMLALARRRIAKIAGAAGRVRFICADARSMSWEDGRYDLVVTNFFLDCFQAEELAKLIEHVARETASGALWIDGDFRIPDGPITRIAAWIILFVMYFFFALTTRLRTWRLTDPAPFLADNGFTLSLESIHLLGFLSSRAWVRTDAQRDNVSKANRFTLSAEDRP